ncbi:MULTISPECIES: DUF2207 domain-containing protein [Bacillaceae]|uniref:Uncharacterized protein n=1 Tax=Evansella alkalicola TaxID=745819 RepID=A0ABS6JZ26_9BACI|nr:MULTISPECIES: DUF2207 domain-containing protein [Bacillaceae]MBU9723346.1 hypothetical protein [Bacillus alkalicola]
MIIGFILFVIAFIVLLFGLFTPIGLANAILISLVLVVIGVFVLLKKRR